jgi:predicted ester cyclase
MSTEQNKAIARRIQEELWDQKNLAVADELLAPSYVDHVPGSPPDVPPGPARYKETASAYFTAFPDVRVTVELQIAEGDMVVTRWKSHATHTGSLFGMPATNKSTSVTGITIDHIVNGKLVESWTEFDNLGSMQKLGVAPRAYFR